MGCISELSNYHQNNSTILYDFSQIGLCSQKRATRRPDIPLFWNRPIQQFRPILILDIPLDTRNLNINSQLHIPPLATSLQNTFSKNRGRGI
jgi:hypothetical protein